MLLRLPANKTSAKMMKTKALANCPCNQTHLSLLYTPRYCQALVMINDSLSVCLRLVLGVMLFVYSFMIGSITLMSTGEAGKSWAKLVAESQKKMGNRR